MWLEEGMGSKRLSERIIEIYEETTTKNENGSKTDETTMSHAVQLVLANMNKVLAKLVEIKTEK